MLKVYINGELRKTEQSLTGDGVLWLANVKEHFDIQGNIVGVSYDGNTKYGVYISGKPEVSPVDFSSVDTDPLTNNLVSLKIDLSDNTVRGKVYYIGNTKDIDFHRPIAGTGVYLDDETFTVYYPLEGDVPDQMVQQTMCNAGFAATTFYTDGTVSDESIYEE